MNRIWSRFRRGSLAMLVVGSLCAVAGCSSGKPAAVDPRGSLVPADARLGAEGRLEDVKWTAPAGGTVHIVDVTDEKLIDRLPVNAGERVVVRMNPGALEIGPRRISRRDIDMNHRIQVYFEEGAPGAAGQ